MKIGIDGRLIGQSGVGRYIKNLVLWLGNVDTENSYVLFLPPGEVEHVAMPNDRWKARTVDVPWHSIREQLLLPGIFAREQLDLLHVPYFTIPILYSGSLIVTVHDLTILHVHTGKATLLPRPLYELKRLGYQFVLWVGLLRAKRILAVSETTKEEIVQHFGIRPEKIVVTREGIDAVFLTRRPGKPTIRIPQHYFLYVGNAYPHKNLEFLVDGFLQFIKKRKSDIQLLLVGRTDPFYRRIMDRVEKLGLASQVRHLGEVGDADLVRLYAEAQALVFPSLMEGFGLPPIEAIAMGTPVIVSDIPIFHELLGEHALFIDPRAPASLVGAFDTIVNRRADIAKGLLSARQEFVKKYSWKETARLTLAAYTASFIPHP